MSNTRDTLPVSSPTKRFNALLSLKRNSSLSESYKRFCVVIFLSTILANKGEYKKVLRDFFKGKILRGRVSIIHPRVDTYKLETVNYDEVTYVE